MRIPKLLDNEAAVQRAEDAARHFDLAIAMQPQVRAHSSICGRWAASTHVLSTHVLADGCPASKLRRSTT